MAWNPSDKSVNITLSNSNRTTTRTGAANGSYGVRSTATALGAKRYLEIVVDSSTSPFCYFGLANSSWGLTAVGGANGWAYYQQTGQKFTNSTKSTYGNAWDVVNTVSGMAYDPIAGKVWFSKNNTWQNSGNPVTGDNPAFIGLASDLYAAVSLWRKDSPANVLTANFATANLVYSPPSGFIAWDADLPAPIFIQTRQPHNSHTIARLGL